MARKQRFSLSAEALRERYGENYYPGLEEDLAADVFGKIKRTEDLPSIEKIRTRRGFINTNPQEIGQKPESEARKFFLGERGRREEIPTVTRTQQEYMDRALQQAPENIQGALGQYQNLYQQQQENPLYKLYQLQGLYPNISPEILQGSQTAGQLGTLLRNYLDTPQGEEFYQNRKQDLGSLLGSLGGGAQQAYGAAGRGLTSAGSGISNILSSLRGLPSQARQFPGQFIERQIPDITGEL